MEVLHAWGLDFLNVLEFHQLRAQPAGQGRGSVSHVHMQPRLRLGRMRSSLCMAQPYPVPASHSSSPHAMATLTVIFPLGHRARAAPARRRCLA